MNNFVRCWDLIKPLMEILQPVKTTLGPQGHTNFINSFSTVLTKDGANVLKNIHSDDPYLMTLLNFIKDNINIISQNTGDGTTTTVVLIVEMLKIIEPLLSHYTSQDIMVALEGVLTYGQEIIEKITRTIDIQDKTYLMDLAMIATNGHKKITNVLVESIQQVGVNGIINVEKVYTTHNHISVEYQRGFSLDMGFSNKYFLLKNNTIDHEKFYKNSYILVSNQRLAVLTEQLQWVINEAMTQQKPLIIIAKEIEGDFLNHLIVAYNRNLLDVITVKATYNSDDFLQDLCHLTDGKMWDNKFLYPLEQYLGSVDGAEINHYKTIIFKEKSMDDYIHHLQKQMELLNEKNSHTYEKLILSQRINKLTGQVAKIKIEGTNEAEKEAIKDAIVDGIHCLKNGLKGGILPGCGLLYFLINKFFKDHIPKTSLSSSIKQVQLLINNSLLSILETIVANGITNGPVIINKIEEFYKYKSLEEVIEVFHHNKDMMLGFNGAHNKLVDIINDGIINAAITEKTSFSVAISMVIHIIKSQYVINSN
jgi:chaperonin GroEL (HSP60 family)